MKPACLLAAALLASAGPAAAETPPQGRLVQPVEPLRYSVWLRADPEAPSFEGRTELRLRAQRPVGSFWIHARDLKVKTATLRLSDGRVLAARLETRTPTGTSRVTWDGPELSGEATLTISYDAQTETRATGLYRGVRQGRAYLATQFQPISARRVFPAFDQPEHRTPFDITVEAPTGDRVVSNAPELTSEPLGDGWVRHRFAPTVPLPTYLVALGVGPYDLTTGATGRDVAGRAVPLRAVTVRGQGVKTGWSLDRGRRLLNWLSAYFQRPFPYPKLDTLAAVQFAGGGMENAGLIVGHELRYLTGPDDPVDRRRRSTTLQAHEIAHQWFGDDVTPLWWNDLWLNEAFATWIQAKAAAAIWPEGEFDRGPQQAGHSAMALDALATARAIRSPIETDASIADAFDAMTYLKGAAVIAMFERYLGPEVFRAGVRRHLARNSGRSVDSDAFFAALTAASGRPEVTESFRSFVDQPGVPRVDARLECLRGRARLHLRQTRELGVGAGPAGADPLWSIPVCLTAYGAGGATPRSWCIMLRTRETTVDAPGDGCPTFVMPNSGGTGYYRFDLTPEQWQVLIAKASDLPAGEALAAVDSLLAAYRSGRAPAALAVRGLSAFARFPAWDVAGAALDGAAELEQDLGPTAEPLFVDWARSLLAHRAPLRGVGGELLTSDLEEFGVLQARSPEVLARLAVDAAAGHFRGNRDLALTAWLWQAPDTALPILLKQLEQHDAALRSEAATALGRADSAERAATILSALDTEGVTGEAALLVLDGLLARAATRSAAWTWMRSHPMALLKWIPEPSRGSRIPRFGRQLCAAQEKAELRTFVASFGAQIAGYERSLAQTEETIDACIASRARRGAELALALGPAYQKFQRVQ